MSGENRRSQTGATAAVVSIFCNPHKVRELDPVARTSALGSPRLFLRGRPSGQQASSVAWLLKVKPQRFTKRNSALPAPVGPRPFSAPGRRKRRLA